MEKLIERKKIFGIAIDSLTMNETVEYIDNRRKEKKPIHVLGINADKINEYAKGDMKFKKIIEEAQITNADGASIILASKLLKKKLPERIAGIDLMEQLLRLCEKNGNTVFFLGAKNYVLKQMILNFEEKYPNLNIVGFRDGYFDDKQWGEIAKTIKTVSPDYVFIGITSPKKEYLIDYFMKKEIPAIFMGVGGSFDVLAGMIDRAPIWMQKNNLEWLFRLKKEPRRLLKRYIIGNTKFIFKVVVEMLKKKEGKS
ncbi:WecB/TagA/CpsF family glycosyltransferase [Enterococcus lactis]|uniref:WecB/TagA/CpsF family glycosyltransferase n=1 Tax=Enterococcus lactis TaxID=357441 RepID=UPI004041C4CB